MENQTDVVITTNNTFINNGELQTSTNIHLGPEVLQLPFGRINIGVLLANQFVVLTNATGQNLIVSIGTDDQLFLVNGLAEDGDVIYQSSTLITNAVFTLNVGIFSELESQINAVIHKTKNKNTKITNKRVLNPSKRIDITQVEPLDYVMVGTIYVQDSIFEQQHSFENIQFFTLSRDFFSNSTIVGPISLDNRGVFGSTFVSIDETLVNFFVDAPSVHVEMSIVVRNQPVLVVNNTSLPINFNMTVEDVNGIARIYEGIAQTGDLISGISVSDVEQSGGVYFEATIYTRFDENFQVVGLDMFGTGTVSATVVG